MKPSRHAFQPDPARKRECRVCGRAKNVHVDPRALARERARERAAQAAVSSETL